MSRIRTGEAFSVSKAGAGFYRQESQAFSVRSKVSGNEDCLAAIERVEGGRIFGWVHFGAPASAASAVELRDGNERIATFVPDMVRTQALDTNLAATCFGFSVELPASLFDGAEHSLRLCHPLGGPTIAGSQKSLQLTAELATPRAEQIRGYFRGIRGILAEGWAFDLNNPDQPLTIEIVEEDRVIASGLANAFCEEAEAPGEGGAFIGFQLPIPDTYLDGRPLRLKARDAATLAYLPCADPSMRRWHENPRCTARIECLDHQTLVCRIERDSEELEQEFELELWIDRLWGERFPVTFPEDGSDAVALRLPIPERIREGAGWTSVFDGDAHEFLLTLADTSLSLASGTFNTALKTYTYDALQRNPDRPLDQLPRFVRNLVLKLSKSALFDSAFYSSKVHQEFANDTQAILHYLSNRERWKYQTSPWLDPGFVNKLAGDITQDSASPLEWYLRQGAQSDVGPNPLFSNADYCIFTKQSTDATPTGASFFDDWLASTADRPDPPNPSALIDLHYIRTSASSDSGGRSDQRLDQFLKSWLSQHPRSRNIQELSPYFDQHWLQQCFLLKHNKPRGCLLAAFRLGRMQDQSPHPILQSAREGKDYYALIRDYEILYASSGIDDLNRLCSTINTQAFYSQFPREAGHVNAGNKTRSSLYRYLISDPAVTRGSFIRGVDDVFITNEYPGLIDHCLEKRGIADVNRIWTRWVRFLGIPGSYGDSLNNANGLLSAQSIQKLRFHKSRTPDRNVRASFIIPTYGRDDLVLRCVLSALESGDVSDLEFIVAEDAPHIDSGWLLAYFLPHATIYRNPKNLGFLLSCKAAVSRSSAKVFILVNNDVLVHKDAIDEMLSTFDRRDDAAVVGGLVLNADGSIQENAGLLWQDASAWNYHRGWKKENEYAYNIRQADYVSGCWIGIRREAWDRLGGFDKRYIPAYYEETDFCLSCWTHGYKVYVNPLSQVTHLDGATMGQDEGNSSNLKSFQKLNRRKFHSKWSTALSKIFNTNGDPTPFHTGRNDAQRYITLIFDHYIPEPDRDAGSRTMWVVCQTIARMDDNYVLFVPENNNRSSYASALEREGIEVITGAEGWKRLDYLLEAHPHLIKHAFVSRIGVAKTFQWHLNKLTCGKSIYIHDIDALRAFQHNTDSPGHEHLVDEAVTKYVHENEPLFSLFDNIVSLSQEETQLLRPYFGSKLVDVFPYDFTPLTDCGTGTERNDILFVGSYNHLPNREAIVSFLEYAWPDVRKALPKARLHLCGSGFENATSLAGENIILHGMVTDQTLNYLYSISRISVAPLLTGAGMKGKVIESCARGVPCVGTAVAWQGIDLPAEYDFLSGDMGTFVKRLLKAYQSFSNEAVEELLSLYQTWSEMNRIAEVIPQLIDPQALL